MNPNYPTLKTVPETTYYFIASINMPDFKWVMEHIYQATDFQKYGKGQFANIIPPNITIPVIQTAPTSNVNHPAKHPCVIISHYDTNDLHEIVCHIYNHTFDELNTYHEQLNQIATQDYLQNYQEGI